jgi:hypothetical protein
MLKPDMAPEQLADRRLFLERLENAGWIVDKNWKELFESSANLIPEALAEYRNDVFYMRLGYYIEENYVFQKCVDRSRKILVSSLRFYPKLLDRRLNIIVDWQNILSLDNYTNFVKNMVPLCNLVLYDSPDGLVKISLNAS